MNCTPSVAEQMERRRSKSSDGSWRYLCWSILYSASNSALMTDGAQVTGVCLHYIWRGDIGAPPWAMDQLHSCSRHGHRGTFWTGPWFSSMGTRALGSWGPLLGCLKHVAWWQILSQMCNSHWPRPDEPSKWTMQMADDIHVQNVPQCHDAFKHLKW